MVETKYRKKSLEIIIVKRLFKKYFSALWISSINESKRNTNKQLNILLKILKNVFKCVLVNVELVNYKTE